MNTENTFVCDDHTIMWFGKHRGEKLANVPEGWLWWWYNNCDKSKLHVKSLALIKYIDDNMEIISQGAIINRR